MLAWFYICYIYKCFVSKRTLQSCTIYHCTFNFFFASQKAAASVFTHTGVFYVLVLVTNLERVCDFLQATFEVFARLHEVLDIVDFGEEVRHEVKEVALFLGQFLTR